MKFQYYLQQTIFILRFRYLKKGINFIHKSWLMMSGMRIGRGTFLPKCYVTWPHKVSIGHNCILEHDINFKFDGIWSKEVAILINDNVFIGNNCEFNIRKKIEIGNNCLIASGCKFIDHDHGILLKNLINKQEGPEIEIKIGNDVWLGCNVIVLKGVCIEDGAVVAAGSVVTKSILENEIWAGVPAKKIGLRY